MRSTKQIEIDVLKENLAPVLASVERAGAGPDGGRFADFHARLDALLEARNLSARQVAEVGALLEDAYTAALHT